MDTYKATNTLNGKFYIGSSVNFKERKKSHLSSKENYPFQNALRANPEAFEWEVWSDDSDERVLEQALLDMWFGKEQCYNLNPKAECPPSQKNRDRPEHEKLKIKEGMIRHWTDENKRAYSEKFSGESNPFWGELHSQSSKEKMSRSKKGRRWWTNEKGQTKMSTECPGEDWSLGRGKLKTTKA